MTNAVSTLAHDVALAGPVGDSHGIHERNCLPPPGGRISGVISRIVLPILRYVPGRGL